MKNIRWMDMARNGIVFGKDRGKDKIKIKKQLFETRVRINCLIINTIGKQV